jgi:hypothetical protein
VFFGVFVFWAVLHRFSILGRLWAFKDVLGFGVGLGLLGVGFGGWLGVGLLWGLFRPVVNLLGWVGLGCAVLCFAVTCAVVTYIIMYFFRHFQTVDLGRSGGFVGSRHTSYQHFVPERQAHLGLR